MKDFTFQSTSIKLFYGESKLPEIVAEIKGYGSKILAVFGGSSFKTNGYYQPFVDALTKEGIRRHYAH